MATLRELRDSGYESRVPFMECVRIWIRWIGLSFSGTKIATLLGVPQKVQEAYKSFSKNHQGPDFSWALPTDPDAIQDELKKPVMNPVFAFHEALVADGDPTKCSEGNPWKGKKVRVKEAHVLHSQFDENGRLREGLAIPYLVQHLHGNGEYVETLKKAQALHEALPAISATRRKVVQSRKESLRKLIEDGFIGDADMFGYGFALDPNQYTEYAPLMGGPVFRQQYIYDFLKGVAYAFEAWNHNPIGKGIIRILCQYAFSRGFDLRFKDDAKKEVWEAHDRKFNISRNIVEAWGIEAEVCGEFQLSTEFWEPIDPSTIWDFVTDPEHVNIEYYAYQSFPTAFQTFTGFKVASQPGSEDQKASDYIIRQIPADKYIRMKINCFSNEKRGRGTLFPILGWLKRVKDSFNAKVVREWMYSNFVWDVEVKGNAGDVNAYISANSGIKLPGSQNVHNDGVKISPMPVIASGSAGSTNAVEDAIMCFIAVAMGIPKEFLNIQMPGAGGSRANSLTSAEPFTKAVEAIQSRWEFFIKQIIKEVLRQNGMGYADGDVEVLFPSVTKDTTTETLQNLSVCQEMSWLSPKTCAEMAAKELNITEYDYEKEMAEILDLQRQGITTTPASTAASSRFGTDPNANQNGSEIHGDGKVNLQKQLKTL